MIGPQLYAIPTPLIVFAAINERQQIPIQIENYYDFIWLEGTYSSNFAAVVAGTDVTFGGALVNVLPAAGQEKVFFTQVPIGHAFGQQGPGSRPRQLIASARFVAGGVVVVDITNLVAGAQSLRLTFWGYRIPPGSPWPIPGATAIATL